ncbi:MAG: peptidoglycan-binding protein [bacterium]|nr:peptidoglycan-binding protein [bacterium]
MFRKTAFTITGLLIGIACISGALVAQAQTYSFNQNLTLGSRGEDVRNLQTFLESKGVLVMPAGVPKGFFGSLTKASLARYQSSVVISPASGYFGPLTRAYINNQSVVTLPPNTNPHCPPGALYNYMTGAPCTSGTTTPTPGSGLSGTSGEISDVNQLSPFSNEEVGEGQRDVKVVGIEVEASNDGDIKLRSMKISFDPAGSTGSMRLERYISSVSIWMGDIKIADVKVDEFSRGNNNIYSRTVALTNAIIRADKSEKFYIAVNGARNLDSNDITGDSWTVNIDNIRYEDGASVTTTNTNTGVINTLNVPINFVSFSQAANTKLKISLDSGSPEAGVVIIDDERNTDKVILLKGKLKVEGTSDVTIDELPVTLTVSGNASDVDVVTGLVRLKIGNKEFSESVSTSVASATITFDRLRFKINAGETVEFSVLADINDIEAGTFNEGDTITAEVNSTNRDFIDAENEQGDQLSNSSEKSGIAIGKTQELRISGLATTLVSAKSSVNTGGEANDDVGLFIIRYTVQAVGNDVYVSSVANTSGLLFTVDKSRVATTSDSMSAVVVNVTDSNLTSTGNYRIEEGRTETFELTVTVPLGEGGTSGLYGLALDGIKWDTMDSSTLNQTHSSRLDSYRTPYVVLN